MCAGLRQLLYGCIAVLILAGIIAYGFLSAPKVIRLDREMQVTAYKLQDANYAKTVTVTLKGAYAEKTRSYTGKLAVNGVQYEYCELNPELGFMICALEGARGEIKPLGQVYADSGSKTWSLALQKGRRLPVMQVTASIMQFTGKMILVMTASFSAIRRKTELQQFSSMRHCTRPGWINWSAGLNNLQQ